jgi:hypothetical protein
MPGPHRTCRKERLATRPTRTSVVCGPVVGKRRGVRLAARPGLSAESVPPEFLNSREDAILIWAVLILAFAFSQNGSAIASSLWSVVCALFGKVFILFALAAAYSAAVLILANRLRVFHASATKEAIYWFFGVGLVLVGNATHATPDSSYAKQVILRRVLTATILTDFVVNFYVFPLGAEIVLVFIIFLFVTLQVVATRDPRAQSAVPFINGVLIAVGLFLFISFAVKVTTDLDGFLTRDTAERLFVVPAMTIAAIPLLYIVAWYSRREQERIRRQLRSA